MDARIQRKNSWRVTPILYALNKESLGCCSYAGAHSGPFLFLTSFCEKTHMCNDIQCVVYRYTSTVYRYTYASCAFDFHKKSPRRTGFRLTLYSGLAGCVLICCCFPNTGRSNHADFLKILHQYRRAKISGGHIVLHCNQLQASVKPLIYSQSHRPSKHTAIGGTTRE